MIKTNLSARLLEGRQILRNKHLELEVLKLGNLRAGNSGLMSSDGDVVGSCHRLAHLRSLGLEVGSPDDSRLIMFQMGTANEDVVFNDLKQTAAPGEVILREHEIPIQWLTSNGTRVTGRPDMVVCRASDTDAVSEPVYGIEIKSIASVWTSRDVLGEQTPKMEHLIQAGHYSWQLGVPFRLLYKQYSIQEIPGFKGSGGNPGWGAKLFPAPGAPGSEHIDYKMGRIQPFEIVYELEWVENSNQVSKKSVEENYVGSSDASSTSPPSSGAAGLATGRRLRFRREMQDGSKTKWVNTLVQDSDIQRFYEFVSRMQEKKELGPRPSNVGPTGKEKNWSRCDPKYCDLAGVCDKYEGSGYSVWLQEVQKLIT